MKNRFQIIPSRFLIITIIAGSLSANRQYAQEMIHINSCLGEIPLSMPDIGLPSFMDTTFYIVDFGASGNGQTLNTNAFKKAIRSCHAAGGGRIIVPAGIWLTGPIRFMSNINLHLEKGALILFSRDHTDYPIIQNPLNKS